ncbi:MAG: HlyD family secretion protein [Polyangia bacterium]
MAGIAVLFAGGDRLIRIRYADSMTDDAYVRADITPLSSRVDGYVVRELVHDYDRVKAGQVLFEIDPNDINAAIQAAQARVQAATAAIAVLHARQRVDGEAVAAARAATDSVTAQSQYAELEKRRQSKLLHEGVGSQQEDELATYDATRLGAEVRRRGAEYGRAESELTMLSAQIKQAEAELSAARAALVTQQLQLSYTKIIAPVDGMVGERQVRVGQLVRPGTPCITMVDIDGVWVTANFKERQLTNVRRGERARIWVDTFPGVEIPARVDELAPASGAQFSLLPPDNATGNFTKIVQRIPVKLLLDIPPALRGRVRPGMSAVVEMLDEHGH